MKTICGAVIASLMLAGCGGGGGGGADGDSANAFAFETTEELNTGLTALIDQRFGAPLVPFNELPSGSARYEGQVGVAAGDEFDPIFRAQGVMELEADFDTNSFTASAGDFVEVELAPDGSDDILVIVGPAEGELLIENGVISQQSYMELNILNGNFVGSVSVGDASLDFDVPFAGSIRADSTIFTGVANDGAPGALMDENGTSSIAVEVGFTVAEQ